MAYSSLATARIQAHSSNYTAGRGGHKIDHITIHHMAGVMSAAQCGAIFAKAGRRGSTHYGVGNGGEIANYVDENDRAWSDSVWDTNCTTVSIETSNSGAGGDWPVGEKAYNSLIKLVADIAKRNGLGTLVAGKNLTWHSMYVTTTCPGNYLRSRIADIAAKANAINGKGGGSSSGGSSGGGSSSSAASGFFPAKGYWTYGDTDARIGKLAAFMYATFPAYTKKAALGNYYGPNLKAAITEFQRRTGLQADGSTGPITYAKLKSYGFKG